MKVAVIGGGAAGYFAAISAKTHHPDAKVFLLEKTKKLLAKVKISGGGRCNVTNGCTSIKTLSEAYPRGGKQLKKAFRTFYTKDTMEWFESRGVPLVIQEDGCVFPKAQDSQVIIDCLQKEAHKLDVIVETSKGVQKMEPKSNGQIRCEFIKDAHHPAVFDKVIIATGGSPKRSGLAWLEDLGHEIAEPVPSLLGYECKVQVNWVNQANNELVRENLQAIVQNHPQKMLTNMRAYGLPDRLWQYLLQKIELPAQKRWSELGKKGINKLVTVLTNDIYQVKGKTTFKEEFVTCGGVSLSSIDFRTMQSKVVPNLYFAGEVMDVDGITGGYNFQSAWTTGFIAGQLN